MDVACMCPKQIRSNKYKLALRLFLNLSLTYDLMAMGQAPYAIDQAFFASAYVCLDISMRDLELIGHSRCAELSIFANSFGLSFKHHGPFFYFLIDVHSLVLSECSETLKVSFLLFPLLAAGVLASAWGFTTRGSIYRDKLALNT